MNGLDLYAKVEEYLDFSEEVRQLHKYFLIELLEKDINSCLDIGCGQGELLEIFALNGISGIGIDLSKKQIEFAKLRGVDARCIDWCNIDEKFPCATATFDVINYIPNNELTKFLTCAYNALEDNGYFIFDINSSFGFEEVAVGTLSIDNDDNFINIDANFEENILITDITLFTKKKNDTYKKEQSFIKQYFYSEEYLNNMLKEIGFTIEKVDQFNLHSDEEADKLIFTCIKK